MTPADDDVVLELRFFADVEHNQVRLDFGKAIAWVAADADAARQIALGLLRAASELDGKILHVRTE